MGLSSILLAALAKRNITVAHILEVNWHDSTTDLYTDAAMDITVGAKTYKASGDFLDFSPPPQSINLDSSEIAVTLAGADQLNLYDMLTQHYVNVPVTISRVVLDKDYSIVDAPFILFFGYIDSYTFTESPEDGTSELEWSVSSHWVDFERKAGRRTNSADQQLFFSGDLGFEFAPQARENIKWGHN